MFDSTDTSTTKNGEHTVISTKDAGVRLVLLETSNLFEPPTVLLRPAILGQVLRQVAPSRSKTRDPAAERRLPEAA